MVLEKGERPWGHYDVLADEADHKVKRVVVMPKCRLSLQRHQKRSEHWCIIHGKALVTVDDKEYLLNIGDSIDIPRQAIHRIENRGEDDMVFIEVQRGDCFGEDDIERLQDDYARG